MAWSDQSFDSASALLPIHRCETVAEKINKQTLVKKKRKNVAGIKKTLKTLNKKR